MGDIRKEAAYTLHPAKKYFKNSSFGPFSRKAGGAMNYAEKSSCPPSISSPTSCQNYWYDERGKL
jgi:hypothetical protein